MVGLNIYVALSSEGILYALDGRMKKGSSWKKGNFICGGLGGATLHRYMIKYHGKSQVFPLNLGSFEFSGFFKLKVFTSPIPYSMIFQLSNANMTSFPSPKTVACTRWDVVFCMFRVSCLGNRVFVGFNTSFVSSNPANDWGALGWLKGPRSHPAQLTRKKQCLFPEVDRKILPNFHGCNSGIFRWNRSPLNQM